MGRLTLPKVRDRSGDTWGGLGRVGEFLGRPGTSRVTLPDVREGWETLLEVWDGSVDPREGPGWVGGPSGRSWTGRGTLRAVQDGSGFPRGCLGRVGKSSLWPGMSRGTLREVRDCSGDPP